MKKIILVAGARPNFIKIAPLMKELARKRGQFDILRVHTGQHYDFEMSEVFFQNLNIPKSDIHLNIGAGSHAAQTACEYYMSNPSPNPEDDQDAWIS